MQASPFYLSLTGEDTARMPLGTHMATLRVYDSESRCRTVANTIMVCVTERIGDAYPGDEEVSVSLGAMVEWRNVSDKPSINGVVLEGNKTTKELGIRGVMGKAAWQKRLVALRKKNTAGAFAEFFPSRFPSHPFRVAMSCFLDFGLRPAFDETGRRRDEIGIVTMPLFL